MDWSLWIALGLWAYICFGGLENSIKVVANAFARRTEAKARIEEARTERVRLENQSGEM
jgi:hypothetical protein